MPKHKKDKQGRDKQRYASHQQRINILKRDSFQCQYCGMAVTLQSANIDHVKPWKFGGRTLGKNLVTACRRCNEKKGNRTDMIPLGLKKGKSIELFSD